MQGRRKRGSHMTTVLQHGVVHPEGGLQPSPDQSGVKNSATQSRLQGSRFISTRMRATARTKILINNE